LEVLKHFMQNRNKMQKAIDDDPHSVDKGNPVAVARALGIKADKTQIDWLDETKVNRKEVKVYDKKMANM